MKIRCQECGNRGIMVTQTAYMDGDTGEVDVRDIEYLFCLTSLTA